MKQIALLFAALKQVLDSMSALPKAEFDPWPRGQQMAFLVNAHNPFTAAQPVAQLEDGTQRVTTDRTRDRVASSKLEVTLIFKRFRQDFEPDWRGIRGLEDLFARRAAQHGDPPDEQRKLRDEALPVTFVDDECQLGAVGR